MKIEQQLAELKVTWCWGAVMLAGVCGEVVKCIVTAVVQVKHEKELFDLAAGGGGGGGGAGGGGGGGQSLEHDEESDNVDVGAGSVMSQA